MPEVIASQLVFMEQLPPSCPPDTAVRQAYDEVWRFVTSNPPVASDFESWAAKKAPPPTVDPCIWSSCSLFLTKKVALAKLPKMRARYGYLAKISLSEKCGFTLRKKVHVDFWRFKSYTPNVLAVEEL